MIAIGLAKRALPVGPVGGLVRLASLEIHSGIHVAILDARIRVLNSANTYVLRAPTTQTLLVSCSARLTYDSDFKERSWTRSRPLI